MPKRENHPDLEFLEPEAGVADVEVALFAEVFDLLGDDLYIIGAVCLSVCHKSDYFADSPKSAYK